MVISPPHLLGDDAGRTLIAAVDEVDDAGRAFDQHVRSALGVNNTDFAVLHFVARERRRGGEVRVGDLAERMGVGSGTATEIVHRLEQAGLVRRVVPPHDGRIRHLELTPAAEARLEAVLTDVRTELDALLGTITRDERTRILELLGAVRDIYRASAG